MKEVIKRDELFYELSELIWQHFLAMDSKGNAGENRNVSETLIHWNEYHRICKDYKKLKIGK